MGNTYWDWLWSFITNKWASIPLYLFLLFLLFKKTGIKSTLLTLGFIALLIVCTDQFSNFLKHLVARPRPCQLDLPARFMARCGRYGFPSAHSFSSMALALFIGRILKPYYKSILPLLILWSLSLGYSRIYLGVHYPGDVLVGLCLGILTGNLFFVIRKILIKKLKFSPSANNWLFPQLKSKIASNCFLLDCQKYFLILLILVAFGLYTLTETGLSKFALEDTVYEAYFEFAAIIVSISGCIIRIIARGHQTEPSNQHPNTTGIYSIMSHPTYTANFLIFIGPVLWTGNLWFLTFFATFYWIYYTEIKTIKQYYLKEKYTDISLSEMESISAFTPDFSRYKKLNAKFNWTLVVSKELKIIFYLLSTYCVFNILGEFIEGNDYNFHFVLIICCLLTGLSVILFRFFKPLTLNEKV